MESLMCALSCCLQNLIIRQCGCSHHHRYSYGHGYSAWCGWPSSVVCLILLKVVVVQISTAIFFIKYLVVLQMLGLYSLDCYYNLDRVASMVVRAILIKRNNITLPA